MASTFYSLFSGLSHKSQQTNNINNAANHHYVHFTCDVGSPLPLGVHKSSSSNWLSRWAPPCPSAPTSFKTRLVFAIITNFMPIANISQINHNAYLSETDLRWWFTKAHSTCTAKIRQTYFVRPPPELDPIKLYLCSTIWILWLESSGFRGS